MGIRIPDMLNFRGVDSLSLMEFCVVYTVIVRTFFSMVQFRIIKTDKKTVLKEESKHILFSVDIQSSVYGVSYIYSFHHGRSFRM